MSLMDLFRSKGSASPSSGSQRGDWKDWFLNREGMAGKFNRRKDEDDWIDYNPYMLFNGGGSVGRDRMGGSYNPRRDPTPNTMGLMQGDLRDTHHYPSGDSSRILAMADERNWDSMPDLADWKQGIGPGARKPIQTIPIFPGTFGDSLEGVINDQTLGNQWAEIAKGGMDRSDLEGIMQMAYRPGAYGTDYDYDDYGPFISPSVLEGDDDWLYDPVNDEYMFDLLRGNLTSIGQGIG